MPAVTAAPVVETSHVLYVWNGYVGAWDYLREVDSVDEGLATAARYVGAWDGCGDAPMYQVETRTTHTVSAGRDS